MDNDDVSRRVKIAMIFRQLTDEEFKALKKAARGGYEGGNPLTGTLREKAVELGLVYRNTGRLRADVYDHLK